MMVSSFWIFLLIASTWDCNCNACAAKARSCSGVIWSRLGEKVMPPIVPEQARNDDKQTGQMAGDYSMLITPPAPTRCHGKPSTNAWSCSLSSSTSQPWRMPGQ